MKPSRAWGSDSRTSTLHKRCWPSWLSPNTRELRRDDPSRAPPHGAAFIEARHAAERPAPVQAAAVLTERDSARQRLDRVLTTGNLAVSVAMGTLSCWSCTTASVPGPRPDVAFEGAPGKTDVCTADEEGTVPAQRGDTICLCVSGAGQEGKLASSRQAARMKTVVKWRSRPQLCCTATP